MEEVLGRELASLDFGQEEIEQAVEVIKALTGTTELAPFIPEVWSREIEREAQENRVMRNLQPYVVLNTELLDKPGTKVYISKLNSLTPMTKLTQETPIDPQEMGGSEIELEPDEWGTGVKISRKAQRRTYINTMEEATALLGESVAQGEDLEIMFQAVFWATQSITSNEDKSSPGELVADDIMTSDALRRARTLLRTQNINGPYMAVLHTATEGDLLGDEQFTDASVYGTNETILTGEIGKFLDITIVATNNVVTADDGSGDITVYRNLLMGKRSLAVAIKANPDFKEDYRPLARTTDIATVMEFAAKGLNPERYCIIFSA